MILTANKANRSIKRAAKKHGTTVIMRWIEWPDGRPTANPVTGATPTDGSSLPVNASATAKCFFHSIAPAKSGVRMNVETAVGDAILDGLPKMIIVTSAGTSLLVVGSVVTEYVLNEGIRSYPVTPPAGTEVAIESLERLYFEIDGLKWKQKEIGDQLQKSWDALHNDVRMARSILIERMK